MISTPVTERGAGEWGESVQLGVLVSWRGRGRSGAPQEPDNHGLHAVPDGPEFEEAVVKVFILGEDFNTKVEEVVGWTPVWVNNVQM